MTFLIILVALLIERFFDWSHVRQWQWFSRYQQTLSRRIAAWSPYLLLLICLLPPLIVVGLLDQLLAGWFYGALKLLFGIAVLMYCMGPGNLWAQTFAGIAALHSEDPSLAVNRVKTAFGISVPDNSQVFHNAFTAAIFSAANQRLFAVVFWFIILGPVGAVLYRLIALLSEQSPLGLQLLSKSCLQLLEWLPVRAFTFLFALGGHFTAAFSCWKKKSLQGLESNQEMLNQCGLAALHLTQDHQIPEDGSAEKESLALIDRTLIIGLVLVAIIVLLM